MALVVIQVRVQTENKACKCYGRPKNVPKNEEEKKEFVVV